MYKEDKEIKENLHIEILKYINEFESNNKLLSDSSRNYVHELESKIEITSGVMEYLLGFIYLDGKLIENDTDKAVEYLKKSHEKKFYDATIALAIMYYYGYIVDKNINLTNEYITNLVDDLLNKDEIYYIEFTYSSELYDLIKKASGLNDFDATKLVSDYYIHSAEDANSIPEYWKHNLDEYYYNQAILWLEDLSNLGDKTAAWRIYEYYTENYPCADVEVLYYFLKTAALYDEYPPAIEEYNKLKESGDLDDFMDSDEIDIDED